MRLFVIWTFVICTMAASAAFAQRPAIRNPHTSPEDVAAGGRIYRSHCAECHGLKGEGGRGPDLTRGEYRHGSSDAALLKTVDDGIPGTEMPGLYHEEHQLWQVVAFVRSLAAGGARQKVIGNAAAGEKLFHGKSGCAACHMIGGAGGRMGPDLSVIGSKRGPRNLRVSILDPDAEVPSAWWMVEAVDGAGKKYSGTRLNEDTFSIQLLDGGKDLVSLRKADLKSLRIETKKSAMPGYQGKLTPAELDDIIAYLYNQQRKAREE